MFKIGEFSKFTRVSVKMLRHYDEIGLLKPAFLDSQNGYRYYSADQLPRLNRIIALKDVGFSLEEIAILLDKPLSFDEIRGMLKGKHAEIVQRLQAETRRLAEIEARLRQFEQEERHPLYDVVLRSVLPQLVVTLREVVPSLDCPLSALFEEVETHALDHNARAVNSPLLIYHDLEFRDTQADVEVAIPLTHAIPSTDRLQVQTMAGITTAACVVYTGDYDHMTDALHSLLIWVQANRYQIVGPLREIYLRFCAGDSLSPRLPEAFLTEERTLYVTELQLPIHPLDQLS